MRAMRAAPAVTEPVLTDETIKRRRSDPVSLNDVLVRNNVHTRATAIRISTAAAQLRQHARQKSGLAGKRKSEPLRRRIRRWTARGRDRLT